MREWLGLRQRELAPLLGVSETQVTRYEVGHQRVTGRVHKIMNRLAMEHAYELVGQRAPVEIVPEPPPKPRRWFWAWLMSLDL